MFLSQILAVAVLQGAAQAAPPHFDGLGGIHRKVTTSSAAAQRYFDQGLAFLYAFNHDESIRAFQEAARLDPQCGMAWWGIATACGPNINNPEVDEDHAKLAWDALANARKGRSRGAETQLIEAASKRFSKNPKASRAPLDKAYADAMRKVWRSHPEDPAIAAMFAEAMMDLRPWDLWTHDGAPQPGTREIERTLERALQLDPKHPLALHLYIHTEESSGHPEKGLAAADRIEGLAPGLGHLVHMPSHIYVRTGRWLKAIESNEDAIVADNAYMAKVPEQGFYLAYVAHNHQMLSFAAMMRGQRKLAVDGMDAMMTTIPEELRVAIAPVLDGYLAAIYEVRVRFGLWDEILAMPDPGKTFPVMQAIRHMARAVSYAVKGEVADARREQYAFYAVSKTIPKDYHIGNNTSDAVLAVASNLMNGEILLGEGKGAASVERLRSAVKAEDALAYNEPPDWLQPTRHALGAVLVQEGRFAEAERVYREDLRRLPNNGWSTYGLAKALAGQGKLGPAKVAMDRFNWIWASADTKIGSSCLCVPGGR